MDTKNAIRKWLLYRIWCKQNNREPLDWPDFKALGFANRELP